MAANMQTYTMLHMPIMGADAGVVSGRDGTASLPTGTVIATGGGGGHKSGVVNKLVCLRVEPNAQGHSVAITRASYDPANQLILSCAVSSDGRYVLGCVNDECILLEYQPKSSTPAPSSDETKGEAVKSSADATTTAPAAAAARAAAAENFASPTLGYLVRVGHVKVGESGVDNELVVTFAPDNTTFACAGKDGVVRIFKLDRQSRTEADNISTSVALTLTAELTGHSKTVSQLSFSPSGSLLASVSADRTCRLWDVKNGVLSKLLPSDAANSQTYRACGFASDTLLVTLQVPTGRGGSSFLVFWVLDDKDSSNALCSSSNNSNNSSSNSKKATWKIHEELCKVAAGKATVMSVSGCGRYAATGDVFGAVTIVDVGRAVVFKKVPKVHMLPITGLAFTTVFRGAEADSGTSNGDGNGDDLVVMSLGMDKVCAMINVKDKRAKRSCMGSFCRLLVVLLVLAGIGIGAFVNMAEPAQVQSVSEQVQGWMQEARVLVEANVGELIASVTSANGGDSAASSTSQAAQVGGDKKKEEPIETVSDTKQQSAGSSGSVKKDEGDMDADMYVDAGLTGDGLGRDGKSEEEEEEEEEEENDDEDSEVEAMIQAAELELIHEQEDAAKKQAKLAKSQQEQPQGSATQQDNVDEMEVKADNTQVGENKYHIDTFAPDDVAAGNSAGDSSGVVGAADENTKGTDADADTEHDDTGDDDDDDEYGADV